MIFGEIISSIGILFLAAIFLLKGYYMLSEEIDRKDIKTKRRF